MDSLLDKAASAVNQAKETATASVETAKAEATTAANQAKETVEAAKTEATTTVNQAREAAEATAESAKTEAASAQKNLTDQVKGAVDGAMSRGIDGVKSLLQGFEEKRGEVSSKIVDAVTHAAAGISGSADSAASRDLPVSTDNQPLLASGQRALESTPWWKSCCGVLDLLKPSAR